MFRPPTTTRAQQHFAASPLGRGSGNSNNNNDNNTPNSPTATSTIREIRSRAVNSTATSNARQLLANRRQAMSMERLNSSIHQPINSTSSKTPSSSTSMHGINNLSDTREIQATKSSSSISGSSNSINGSTTSSPSRASSSNANSTNLQNHSAGTAGLNRTASRVSRFRSAKAVFERLSSANAKQLSEVNNIASTKQQQPMASVERPKLGSGNSVITSRYAMARTSSLNNSYQQSNSLNNSPRSRLNNNNNQANSPTKSTITSRSLPLANNNNNEIKTTITASQQNSPKPQPRVIPTKRGNIATGVEGEALTATTTLKKKPLVALPKPTFIQPKSIASTTPPPTPPTTTTTTTTSTVAQAKPPPKDLIDKIVLEIALDANKTHDLDCTIQDLSNCDISGIPETLDFDQCFQDVEMMTEEEARKLLSKKSDSPDSADKSNFVTQTTNESIELKIDDGLDSNTKQRLDYQEEEKEFSPISDDNNSVREVQKSSDCLNETSTTLMKSINSNLISASSLLAQSSSVSCATTTTVAAPSATATSKAKVRFSDEPAQVYDTHAVEDYDRRNDDIDPVAASAEYEIEKSRERDNLVNENENENDNNEDGERLFNNKNNASSVGSSSSNIVTLISSSYGNSHDVPQLRSALRNDNQYHYLEDNKSSQQQQQQQLDNANTEQADCDRKDYIESLEREVNLKRILEQNLRDLQSQYYETVKQLDNFKCSSENELAELKQSLAELQNKFESSQNELTDSREQCNLFEKQLNDNKESSQLLEKKYHRAKKIIKDMQSREESFTRREQLYQQKLDEIEHELGLLINTFDCTIYDEALKYFTLLNNDNNNVGICTKSHQIDLDAFGLLKQILTNFQANQATQSAQIKQRIVSMLEQNLANLIARSNNCTIVSATISSGKTKLSKEFDKIEFQQQQKQTNSNHHPYAAHRLSHPNLPYPIGVGGQPTKIFHGLGPQPNILTTTTATIANESSPPHSVNSYPSSNSLNSLNTNNNQATTISNNNIVSTKLAATAAAAAVAPVLDAAGAAAAASTVTTIPQQTISTSSSTTATTTTAALMMNNDLTMNQNSNIIAPNDLNQTPFQTNEWHDKPVSEWTTNQVSTWLLALGLDQYISKFEDRNVNGQSLINLDSTVLKGLGVLNSNDRNLLKKKIRELRVIMERERKQIEKKLKENLKDKSKTMQSVNNNSNQANNNNKPSWKKGLLS